MKLNRLFIGSILMVSLLSCTFGQSIGLRQVEFPDFVATDAINGRKIQVVVNQSIVFDSLVIWDNIRVSLIDGKVKELYSVSEMKTDKDGFIYLASRRPYKLRNGKEANKYYLLPGGGFFLEFRTDYSPEVFPKYFDAAMNDSATAGGVQNKDAFIGFVDDGILRISAWSELVEKTVNTHTYKPDNMRRAFALSITDRNELYLNAKTPPWAEGVSGPGIGGTIDVEFNRPAKEIDILNGYVDLAKRNLYKENNRLKTIRIDSENPKFTTDYKFEDIVKFHTVPLPQAATKVRITILDVYKGTKYDDTCVTKLFIPQQELRPRAEYEAVIEKALRKAGYLK